MNLFSNKGMTRWFSLWRFFY